MMDPLEKAVHLQFQYLVNNYARLLPKNSLHLKEDLYQECWVVYSRMVRKRRFDPDKARFETWIAKSAEKEIISILMWEKSNGRTQMKQKEGEELDERFLEEELDTSNDPERLTMIRQALSRIAEESFDLARCVVEGLPPEVTLEAKRQNRIHQTNRGGSALNGSIRVTKLILERILGVDLEYFRRVTEEYF